MRAARSATRRPYGVSASALLQLMRLASPSLPVGGFSYSDGFEAAFEAGLVPGEAQALAWLLDQLQLSLARGDLPVVAHAARAWKRHDEAGIVALNAWVTTTRESSEWRLQSEQMGRSLTQWLRQHEVPDTRLQVLAALAPAPTWPIAFALAGTAAGASTRAVLLAFAAGWAENMTQAAMKAIPLGQAAGQRLLAALSAAIPHAVGAASRLPFEEMQAFAPMLAILSSQHEAQYSRLFRS
jgi:urease accessory protein